MSKFASSRAPLLFLLLALNPPVLAQSALQGLDLFGTSQVSLEKVRQEVGAQLEKLAEDYRNGDREAFGQLHEEITGKLQTLGDFAFAGISLIQYFQEGQPIYITLDFVDSRDRESRMNFLPEPSEELDDPEGLLAAWKEYEETSMQLLRSGAIDPADPKSQECPAIHCIVGFGYPQLSSFGDLFEEQVPRHAETLLKVLRQDRRPERRGAAAFLLAHADRPNWIIRSLTPSIRDPSSLVRNNVLRVLAMAARDPELELPLAPLLEALHFPATTDRNKVLAALNELAARETLKARILRGAGSTLVELLHLQQPNNHDYAYSILKKLSGRDFGERNYVGWTGWLEKKIPGEAL